MEEIPVTYDRYFLHPDPTPGAFPCSFPCARFDVAISCGHCGGQHATVAEVRACTGTLAARDPSEPPDPPDDLWSTDLSGPPGSPSRTGRALTSIDRDPHTRVHTTGGPSTRDPSTGGPPSPGDRHRPERPGERQSAAAVPEAPVVVARSGPPGLGRTLVVAPGQEVPAPWDDSPRFVVDDDTRADPAPLIERLQPYWNARRPYVVELAAPLDRHPDEVDEREPWRLDPAFTFPLAQLAHLVWSNALDLRRPDQPRLDAARGAVAAGATVATDADVRPSGDVREPGDTTLWCDGGPLDLGLAERTGQPVGHAFWLEQGHAAALHPTPTTADLAADQLAAVAHPGGPCRVISPAGSGKTRTLTERARHLVADCGLPPGALTLVAYNTRAAGEMRERLAGLQGLQIRTLNSLGLAVLGGTGPFRRPVGSSGPPAVLDERGVRDHIERLVKLPRRANTDPAAAWIEALGQVRLGLRSPDEVEADYQGDVDGFAEFFPRYREALRRAGAVDFDEQIYGAIEVLLRDPAARRTAQRSCRVMLVDEFQDLTPAHLLLIRLLAAPAFDVFGVGDDDQTIYGYQGADPGWLIRYADYFPGAADHPLTVNYRCPPPVVRAATNLLTRNRRRVAKTIDWPPGRADDPSVVGVVLSGQGTVAALVDAVRRRLDEGASERDIVVLTRVNATLAPVQVALVSAGIAVDPVPGIRGWLTRTGVRSALAWVDLAVDPRRLSAGGVREAARRPPRSLSPKVLDWMAEQRDLAGLERLAGRISRERDQEKVLGFVADVRLLADLADGATTAEVLAAVRDRIGLGGAVESLDRSRGRVDRSTHGDDLDALCQIAALRDDPRTFRAWLTERLQTEVPAGEGGRVALSTVHRVKGLEWPHVLVHEASASLFPHRLAADVEEERRIFHVALTRCSQSVTVVAPADLPSPFLAELAAPGVPPAPAPEPVAVPATRARPGQTGRSGVGAGGPPPDGVDIDEWKQAHALHEALRAWRRARSQADGVPAFVVFADRTLDDLVARRPTDYAGLRACHGIGPAKVDNYGDDILAVIAEFLE